METPAPEWVRGRLLGRGSFAAVNLAAVIPAGRLFAVKSVELSPLHAPPAAALDDEIRLLKTLYSPYVVNYIADDVTAEAAPASGEVRRYRNLHMEYVPGGTAAEGGAMEERRVRAVARRVALAAEYLHSRGVVHGDVKGRNVLLGPPEASGGAAKLADFGSATVLSGDRRGVGKITGTPLWMAPEVARGESPSPAADIWSLGCTSSKCSPAGRRVGGAPPRRPPRPKPYIKSASAAICRSSQRSYRISERTSWKSVCGRKPAGGGRPRSSSTTPF